MHDVRSFDRFARLYDAAMWGADVAAIERGLALARGPVERVVDVGGGTGRVARDLEREAVVVDAAPGMVRRAVAAGVPGVLGDATRLPFREGSVDAVLVVDALHHFGDAAATVAEAARVLRRGGVLVVRDFDPTTLRGRGVALAERLVGFDSEFRSPEAMRETLRNAGFEPVTVEGGFTFTAVGVRTEPGEQ